jgi:hypothetical protein
VTIPLSPVKCGGVQRTSMDGAATPLNFLNFYLPAILPCTCAQVAILTKKVLWCRKRSLKDRYLTPAV